MLHSLAVESHDTTHLSEEPKFRGPSMASKAEEFASRRLRTILILLGLVRSYLATFFLLTLTLAAQAAEKLGENWLSIKTWN